MDELADVLMDELADALMDELADALMDELADGRTTFAKFNFKYWLVEIYYNEPAYNTITSQTCVIFFLHLRKSILNMGW